MLTTIGSIIFDDKSLTIEAHLTSLEKNRCKDLFSSSCDQNVQLRRHMYVLRSNQSFRFGVIEKTTSSISWQLTEHVKHSA